MDENNPTTQRTERKQYSPQFKDQALARAEKIGVPQAAEDLGIPPTMLYSWRTKLKQGGQSIEQQKRQQAQLSRLKREVNRLEEEINFKAYVFSYFFKY